MPLVLHIAGTNGKGSSAAFAAAILRAHGLRTAVYTSPHLVSFNERLQLPTPSNATAQVSLALFAKAINKAAATKVPLTPFELLTAAAFYLIARGAASGETQATVIETGLGGRLDATNVVRSQVGLITPIALDHCEYLGPDLASIAFEKAGIMRPGAHVISAEQNSAAAAVLQARASALRAPLLPFDDVALPPLPLAGAHQHDNARGAYTAVRLLLGRHFKPDKALLGLTQARHPARMQRFYPHFPLPHQLPEGVELWMDGAHNVHGAQAAAVAVPGLTHIVFACGAMRQPQDLLAPFKALRPTPQIITFAEPPTAGLRPLNDGDIVLPDLAAWPAWVSALPPTAKVLCTGSLYFCGALLKNFS